MNPRARSAPKFCERIEILNPNNRVDGGSISTYDVCLFVCLFFQKVEVEDLYTWPFKLTQNMVQKNIDKIKKTQIKSQHLLREKYDTGS